jgi:hypothetical protein
MVSKSLISFLLIKTVIGIGENIKIEAVPNAIIASGPN